MIMMMMMMNSSRVSSNQLTRQTGKFALRYRPDLYWRRIIRLGRAWTKNGSSSDNPSVYK